MQVIANVTANAMLKNDTTSHSYGGAVYSFYTYLTVDTCNITDNEAIATTTSGFASTMSRAVGGGMLIYGGSSASNLKVQACNIVGNKAIATATSDRGVKPAANSISNGGGLSSIEIYGKLTVDTCNITGNEAIATVTAFDGTSSANLTGAGVNVNYINHYIMESCNIIGNKAIATATSNRGAGSYSY